MLCRERIQLRRTGRDKKPNPRCTINQRNITRNDKLKLCHLSLRVLCVSVVEFLFIFEIPEVEGNIVLGRYELVFRIRF